MIRFAIIDDETEVANKLTSYIDKYFQINNCQYEVKFFDTASKFLENYHFDFDAIFMDINMPGVDGMSATKELRRLDKNVKIIFVTSLAQYAIKGYEVNAFDFVVKPVNYYTFAMKLDRFMENYREKEGASIIIKANNSFIKTPVSDIKYIEVSDHKLIVHTISNDFETYDTLSNYLNLLKNEPFALCNRCYLVNLKYVNKVNKDAVYIGNNCIQMSRRKYKEFMNSLNKYLGNGGDIDV